jgi:hypothetical protein
MIKMKYIVYVIIIVILFLSIVCINNLDTSQKDNFENIPTARQTATSSNANIYEKDRTLLYGSVFLDNLDEQIKNMTDPRIKYDEKRIDIVKYSDVLL